MTVIGRECSEAASFVAAVIVAVSAAAPDDLGCCHGPRTPARFPRGGTVSDARGVVGSMGVDLVPVRLLLVCGSLQQRSANRSALDVARSVAVGLGAVADDFEGLGDIPAFNPDLGAEPASVAAWRAQVTAADAVLARRARVRGRPRRGDQERPRLAGGHGRAVPQAGRRAQRRHHRWPPRAAHARPDGDVAGGLRGGRAGHRLASHEDRRRRRRDGCGHAGRHRRGDTDAARGGDGAAERAGGESDALSWSRSASTSATSRPPPERRCRRNLRTTCRSGRARSWMWCRPAVPAPNLDKEEDDMTQYLLSVWHDDDYELDFSSDEAQRMVAQVDAFNAELQPPAPGCSPAACTRPPRPPSCAPPTARCR